MNKYFILIFYALLAACATSDAVINYKGNDAGKVVIGIGAASGTNYSSYSLLFRKIGSKEESRFIHYMHSGIYREKLDYDNLIENGIVQSHYLAPGEYEIYNFLVHLNGGTFQNHYKSKIDFSIPFSIHPNKITYLGNYQAHKITGENIFGLPVHAGAFFVVYDQHGRDLGFVKNKSPDLEINNFSNQVPKAISVSPFFISSEAYKDNTKKEFALPANEKSGLYIFRNSRVGIALKKTVSIDGKVIGETKFRTYFYRELTAGTHELTTESTLGDNKLTINFVSGKNYYVEQDIKLSTTLKLVNEDDGKKAVSGCDLIE